MVSLELDEGGVFGVLAARIFVAFTCEFCLYFQIPLVRASVAWIGCEPRVERCQGSVALLSCVEQQGWKSQRNGALSLRIQINVLV